MGNFTFENQGANTFLVYTIEDGQALDTLSLGMLTNNRIDGIIPVVYLQMDSVKYLKYNISSRVSLQQYFQGMVSKRQFLTVFYSIARTMLLIEEYMIIPGSILFDMDRIYVDVSNSNTELVCLPLMDKNSNVDMGKFFKNIVFSIRFNQNENCDYVTRIINYLNSTDHFSLLEFQQLLKEMLEEWKQASNGQLSAPQPRKMEREMSSEPQPPAVELSQPPVPPQQPMQVQPTQTPPFRNQDVSQNRQSMKIPGQENTQRTERMADSSIPNASSNNSQSTAGKPETKKSRFWPFGKKEKKDKGKKNVKPMPSGNYKIPGQINQGGSPIPDAGIPNGPAQGRELEPKPQTPVIAQPVQPLPKEESAVRKQPERNMNFGKTVVLNQKSTAAETTVLDQSMNHASLKPYFIRQKTGEQILISQDLFKLGKEPSYANYCILDNSAVSRGHANIITKEQKYYIVDTNSKNHTFVNGNIIQPNIEYPLSDGSAVRLADEEFEFRLM